MIHNNISLIIPVAGFSSRMQETKSLLDIEGTPMISYVISQLALIPWGEIIVVLGHKAEIIYPILKGMNVLQIYNPYYKKGLMASLRSGISKISPRSNGFCIVMADMPEIRIDNVQGLIDQFYERRLNTSRIIYASFGGRQGHPVIYSRHFIEEFYRSSSGKEIIRKHGEVAAGYEWSDNSCLLDLDTPIDYQQYIHKYFGNKS